VRLIWFGSPVTAPMEPDPAPPRYIVDASVAVKWYLRDEHDTAAADALLTDFREDRIQLIAPDHIRYEVPSAFRNAMRTNRLTLEQVRRAIAGFLAWPITTVRDEGVILAACDQAVRFGCSSYDGVYLALAESTQYPFIHADLRPRNALGTQFPLAIWLPDYPSRT
jgi:predicted nucleic acid-binding protein